MHNSLIQTVLKLTAPGVPDLYNGTELWDLSMVDPDNRRPVDYTLRQRHAAAKSRRRCSGIGTLLAQLARAIGTTAASSSPSSRRCCATERSRPTLYTRATISRCRRSGARAEEIGAYARARIDGD